MHIADFLVPQGIEPRGPEKLLPEAADLLLDCMIIDQAPEREAFAEVLFNLYFRGLALRTLGLGGHDGLGS